ncbi:hypothetical protein EB118_06870 [bacterium]|nr:hypothetical protein [bacterium]
MSELQKLKEKIDQLEESEHEQIFDIIRRHTQEYTRSDNGVYVSSKNLTSECIQSIEKYVNFCFDQRIQLEKHEELRARYIKLIKTDVFS